MDLIIKKSSYLISLLLFSIQPVFAFDHGHTIYNELLNNIVINRGPQTDVNYELLNKDPSSLNRYIGQVESVSENDYKKWSSDQQLAFLINAYNALTLKLINMHYPGIDSIRNLGGLIFSSPWDIKFFTIFGQDATLDYIEHEIIRKDFEEPRIHFAVNCASRGCPPLLAEAYIADKLDQQLDYVTKQFLRDPERNRFNAEKTRLELSSILKWYKHDFEKAAGSVEKFIAPYITDDPDTRTLISNRAASIKYLDYDWALNAIRK